MKIYHLLYLTALLGLMSPVRADKIDSLKTEVSQAHTTVTKLNALLALSWELKNRDPSAAWERAVEALEIAEQTKALPQKALAFKHMGVIKWYDSQLDASRAFLDSARIYFQLVNDPKGEADVLNNLGLNYHITGDFGSAQRKYNEALRIRKEQGDAPGTIITLINLGVMYDDLEDHEMALEMYSQALQLEEKNNDKARQADTYLNIGLIYYQEKQFESAVDNYQDALEIFESTGDTRGIADVHVNWGDVQKSRGDYEGAIEHFRTSQRLFEQLEDKLGTTETLRSLGMIFLRKDNLSLAKQYFDQSRKLSQQIEDEPGRALSLLYLGEAYLRGGDLNQGIPLLERSVKMAEALEIGGELRDGYNLLAEAYAQKGDFEQAYLYEQKETRILDTTYSAEKAIALSRLVSLYELKRQKQDMALLKERNKSVKAQSEKRRIQLILALTILSAIILLTAVLYHFYRQKRGQNKILQLKNDTITQQKDKIESQNLQLEDKNDKLKELNEEKNYLMGVVAHDLKNPMAQIKGLVNIINLTPDNLTEEQQKFLNLIDQSADRLTEMVHRILDVRAAESATLNLNPQTVDLRQKAQEVFDQYERIGRDKGVNLHLDLPQLPQWVNVDIDATLQIFDNLVSNAIKFSPKERNVFLQLRQEAGEVIFTVKDEGPGLTPSDMKKLFGRFQKLSARPTGGENSSGLGLSIVKKFAEAMDGNVWAESQPGEGATFFVRFPVSKETPVLIS